MLQLERAFAMVEVIDSLASEDGETACRDADLIVSFLSDRILHSDILERANVNFHPAPPAYPGRGSASFALFDGSPTFGATAHRMVKAIDAGEIYLVKEFPIEPDDTCESLFARGEIACVDLLERIVDHILAHGEMPPPSKVRWARKATSRKSFENWLMLDPNDEDEFHRKIAAARHPRFSGPYVRIHGHLFELMNDDKLN